MPTTGSEQLEQQETCQGCPSNYIMRLPPEVLGIVFAIYSADFWSDYSPESTPWMRILHVCRFWRDVSFSTPQLWTHIETASLEFAESAIEHSGNLPLDVGGYGLGDQTSVRLRLLKELPRIRSLSLALTSELLNFLGSQDIVSTAMPLLDTLTIDFVPDEDPPTDIPLFSGAPMGRLKTLTVQFGAFLPIRSLIRPTLQILVISYPTPFSVAQMVDLLANLPVLLAVFLHDAVFHPSADLDDIPLMTRTVKLSRLWHITIREHLDSRAAAYLFAYLDLTECACVEFHAEELASWWERFTTIDSLLRHALMCGGRQFCPGSIEVYGRKTQVNIRLWYRPFLPWIYRPADSEESETSERPALAVYLRTYPSDIVPIINDSLGFINFSRLTSLSLTGSYTHKIDLEHLAWMKCLGTLLIRGPVYPYSLVEELSRPIPLAGIGPADFLLPRLKNLELSGVLWRPHPDDVESPLWWHLIESLRCRARCALQLEVDLLTITYPGNLFSADIEAMWDLGAADHYAIDTQGYHTDDKPPSPLETPAGQP